MECWIGHNVVGSGHAQSSVTIPKFTWRNWETAQEMVRAVGVPAKV